MADFTDEEEMHVLKRNGNYQEVSFDKILNFVTETGGIDYAYRKAEELSREGLEAISSVGDSVYYDALRDMVKFTTARNS